MVNYCRVLAAISSQTGKSFIRETCAVHLQQQSWWPLGKSIASIGFYHTSHWLAGTVSFIQPHTVCLLVFKSLGAFSCVWAWRKDKVGQYSTCVLKVEPPYHLVKGSEGNLLNVIFSLYRCFFHWLSLSLYILAASTCSSLLSSGFDIWNSTKYVYLLHYYCCIVYIRASPTCPLILITGKNKGWYLLLLLKTWRSTRCLPHFLFSRGTRPRKPPAHPSWGYSWDGWCHLWQAQQECWGWSGRWCKTLGTNYWSPIALGSSLSA